MRRGVEQKMREGANEDGETGCMMFFNRAVDVAIELVKKSEQENARLKAEVERLQELVRGQSEP